jgi:hypothetical protein
MVRQGDGSAQQQQLASNRMPTRSAKLAELAALWVDQSSRSEQLRSLGQAGKLRDCTHVLSLLTVHHLLLQVDQHNVGWA